MLPPDYFEPSQDYDKPSIIPGKTIGEMVELQQRLKPQVLHQVKEIVYYNRNQDIAKEATMFAEGGIPVEAKAYQQLEKLIDLYRDDRKRACLPSQELSLYMLANEPSASPRAVISEFYVAQDQTVTPSLCTISMQGTYHSYNDITHHLEKSIAGWTHSHGFHRPFFSSIDDKNFDQFLTMNPYQTQLPVTTDGVDFLYDMQYSYGLVVNEAHDTPFTTINVSYPQYLLQKNGEVSEEFVQKRFDHIALLLQGDGLESFREDYIHETIDQLRKRVTIEQTGLTLEECITKAEAREFQSMRERISDLYKQYGAWH